MSQPEPLARLIGLLARLPGIGRRSAERIALLLVRDGPGLAGELSLALANLPARVKCCSLCGNVTLAEADPCRLCTDPRRDPHVLCVVEEADDIPLIEKAGVFHGRYHALMGRLSPMRGEGLHNTRIEGLLKRVREGGVQEVILALGTNVESDATAAFIAHELARAGLKVSRLALGIPAGSELAYSDPVTLSRAIQGRQPV